MAGEIKVGIWGGSASGKTTYLAALGIAALKYTSAGRWTIRGRDDRNPRSSEFLLKNTQALLRREFPEATQDANAATYSYQVNGHLVSNSGRLVKKLFEVMRIQREVGFVLEIHDYPGGALLDMDEGRNQRLWEHLANCQGLIYLFDPHKEDVETVVTGTSNFAYLQHSLEMIMRVLERNRPGAVTNGRLPQHLALCITKFDDDIIFRRLLNQRLIARDRDDPRQAPFVTDPLRAVKCLADTLTVNTVLGFFEDDRVNFFATSSIGFYVDRQTGVVDIERCSNTRKEQVGLKDGNGQPTTQTVERDVIAGEVNPVNVFEPLLWLHSKISNGRQS